MIFAIISKNISQNIVNLHIVTHINIALKTENSCQIPQLWYQLDLERDPKMFL